MDEGLVQTMKRALSIEFNEAGTAAAASSSSNAKRFAPAPTTNDVIILPNENGQTSQLRELASLVEIFPDTEPTYLATQLRQFNYNIDQTIDHIFLNPGPKRATTTNTTSARTTPNNNLIVNNNSKQTATADNSADEIESSDDDDETVAEPQDMDDFKFIMSIFPDLKSSAALKVIHKVKLDANIRANMRRENYADYIISHGYHEKYAKKKKTSRASTDRVEETAGTSGGASNLSEEEMYQIDFESVQSVVNDCAPDYIHEQLRKQGANPRRVELVVNEMLEKKSYPRLRDYMSKKKKEQDLDAHLNMNIDFEEFVKLYPDPREHFYDKKKDMSESYKNHCRTLLYNNFIMIAKESLDQVLQSHNWHLTPSMRQLEDAYTSKKQQELRQRIDSANQIRNAQFQHRQRPPPPLKFSRQHKVYKLEMTDRPMQSYPDSLDDHFFRECFFLRHEREIIDYIQTKKEKRKKKLEEAKRNKSLKECGCCFGNELLDEDLLPCTRDHEFCKECIKSYIETSIGNCTYQFVCLEGTCEGEFDKSVVEQVLSVNMMSAYIRNKQNDEIKKANISNLETCPFCTYAEIIENADEKVFYCKNPDCLKETCRKCYEPNHLPLRCDEIEKKQQVDMRTWIENRVTESMIRVCHKCGQRFYKVEGCNMMHCVCGASMCYLCREPIKDYNHFAKPDGCKQNSDTNEVHQKEMKEAYEKATEEYLKLHPEAKEVELKYDPKKLLEEGNKKTTTVTGAAAARLQTLQRLEQELQEQVRVNALTAPTAARQQRLQRLQQQLQLVQQERRMLDVLPPPPGVPRPVVPIAALIADVVVAGGGAGAGALMNEMNRLMEIRAAQNDNDDDDDDSDLDDSDLDDSDLDLDDFGIEPGYDEHDDEYDDGYY